MSETCKLAAILVADVVDVGADEDHTLARVSLRSDLTDPAIAAQSSLRPPSSRRKHGGIG
jgi:hypothetical protein